MEDILNTGDNNLVVDTDWELEDFGEVIEMIRKMPKQDTQIIHYSQYSNPTYFTGCTIMSGINAVATVLNYDFSEKEIKEIFDLAILRGRSPGSAWARGSGWDTVRRWRNNKYPKNKMMLFIVNLFTDEFYEVVDKLGVFGISIRTDSKYWKDVRADLKLDGDSFARSGGHATCMIKILDYLCIDSIPQNNTKDRFTPMVYKFGNEDKIDMLNTNGNLRKDTHIIIMENRLKQKDPKEVKRLEEMKTKLENAILINSDIWHLTNSLAEKEERNRQNNYNRAKLKVIEAMLMS